MLYTLTISLLAGYIYVALSKRPFNTSLFLARLGLMALLTILLLRTSRIQLILGLLIFFAIAWYHLLKGHHETNGSF